MITEHTICALPENNDSYYQYALTVEYRGEGRWAVKRRSLCLGADGEWDYEPSPSNREDNWLATHRFDEQTALRLAEEQAPLMTCSGVTVAEALERSRR